MKRKAIEPLAQKDSGVHPYHEKGMGISVYLSDNTMKSMRLILTQVEAILGDTKQAEAFKKVVKHEFYRLKDFNQHAVYRTLGVEASDITRSLEPNDESNTLTEEDINS